MSAATQAMSRELEHFLDLADSGQRIGSSSGAKYARSAALILLETVPGLDDKALAGLVEFVQIAKMAPQTARDLIGL